MSPIPKTGVGVHRSTSFYHRNHFFVFRNEHAQSTTLGPKLMFGVVSRNFVAARHPFRKWVSGCIQSTSFSTITISSFFATNMPTKLLRVQNSCFGWFRAISLPHVTHSENGCLGAFKARVLATGTISLFFATNMPNPLLWVQNSCLGWFHAILLSYVTHSENGCRGAFKARVFATGTISLFFATNMPTPYCRSKTHGLGGFAQFCCRTSPIP
jgi:hypothetical protein